MPVRTYLARSTLSTQQASLVGSFLNGFPLAACMAWHALTTYDAPGRPDGRTHARQAGRSRHFEYTRAAGIDRPVRLSWHARTDDALGPYITWKVVA